MSFHGGNIYKYNTDILDYSSNINPLGVPESFRKALIERADEFTRYPDIEYAKLKSDIAQYSGFNTKDHIICGNGAVEIIYKYMAGIARLNYKRAVCLIPTFSEYSKAAESNGIETVKIPAFFNHFNCIDYDRLIGNADDKTAVVLCNPNNPTGTLTSKSDVLYLAKILRNKRSRLLIDEAFVEFTDGYPETSIISELENYPNIMLIRAVTKYFGLPGIRLGYGITFDDALLDTLKYLLEPWNINTAAVIAASTVLFDSHYIEKTKQWLKSERKYLYDHIKMIDNMRIFKTNANFYLVEILDKNIDAWKLRDMLVTKGILIRTPDGFEGLSPYHVRLAVKARENNDCLIVALAEVMSVDGEHISWL